jgi:hypothetical protein
MVKMIKLQNQKEKLTSRLTIFEERMAQNECFIRLLGFSQ